MTESSSGPESREPAPFPGFDVDDLGDFAEEHRSVSFSEQMAGGPEHAREAGSPRGLAGMDG